MCTILPIQKPSKFSVFALGGSKVLWEPQNSVFTHVNVMIMPVCAVQLPVGHAVLHVLLKVSVGLKEVRCTQHSAVSLRRERNLSTLYSLSTLVTQASSEVGAHTHTRTVTGNHADKTSYLHKESVKQGKVTNCVRLCSWFMWFLNSKDFLQSLQA